MHHTSAVSDRQPGLRRSTGALAIVAVLLVPYITAGVAPANGLESSPAEALPLNIRSVFSPDQTSQYVMTVEAAMARAQAAYGAIPKPAADEITRKAEVKYLPREELEAERAIVQHRMVALLNVWRRQLEPDARQFLHYGATTVDIYDTVLTLQLLRSADLIIDDLRELEGIMIDLARSGKDAVMAGRTLGQHALPITFGKKVSTWLGENRRNIERIKALRAELRRCAILKGAVGTYAGLGDRAIEIETAFAKELGLAQPFPDDWHGTRDVFANYAWTLSLISKSFARIGQEIFLLQMTDIGEAAEARDPASVSSSSLAQKTNPSKSEALIHAGRVIPRLADVILDDVVNFFERDNTSGPTTIIEEISVKTEVNLEAAKTLLSRLKIDREMMRKNLDRSQGLIMSQRIVFALSPRLGKEKADERVHEIIRTSLQSGLDFRSALLNDPVVAEVLSASQIDVLLQPGGYTGLAGEQVDTVIRNTEEMRASDAVE